MLQEASDESADVTTGLSEMRAEQGKEQVDPQAWCLSGAGAGQQKAQWRRRGRCEANF